MNNDDLKKKYLTNDSTEIKFPYEAPEDSLESLLGDGLVQFVAKENDRKLRFSLNYQQLLYYCINTSTTFSIYGGKLRLYEIESCEN